MKRWLHSLRLAQVGKREVSGAGYTVTEVMIVLAVTTLLFVAVVMMFAGRQGRAEFTEAVRHYESQLQTVISEVSNGFSATTQGGASENRIFLGKMLVMQPDGLSSEVRTIIGKRTTHPSGGGVVGFDVAALAEAEPEVTAETSLYNHRFQLKVLKVLRADAGASGVTYEAFGFLNRVSGSSEVAAGSRLIQLYALTDADNLGGLTLIEEGLRVCLEGQNGQRAEVLVGENRSYTTIYSELDTSKDTGPCNA